MEKRTESSAGGNLLDLLPERLKHLALDEASTINTEHGEWLVQVERPPKEIERFLPPGAVLIANNGYGDYLFLKRTSGAGAALSPVPHVYWHEGPQIEILSHDIGLVAESSEGASPDAPPLYSDGAPVLLGDHVRLRVWIRLFRKVDGTVVYVPGISKRRPQLEHSGLRWVGIRVDVSSTVIGSWIEPKTNRLQRGVKLIGRGESHSLSSGRCE